ncbi:MAG: integrin alpha [Gammaproteobacteria bacterium]
MPRNRVFTPRRALLTTAVLAALGGAPHAWGQAQLSALNGANGFKINGNSENDQSGRAVSGLGDVNGDGRDDLLIGAPFASSGGSQSGSSYVVFGSTALVAGGVSSLAVLNGANGFQLSGVASGDNSGWAVSGLEDVNGDGLDDLIIGAPFASANGIYSGASYVVFGKSNLGASGSFFLGGLDGVRGFQINGALSLDQAGRAVSGLGDVNGDGVADLLIGAPAASPNGSQSGASYVVFGGTALGAGGVLQLSALNGANGFKISGVAASDRSGIAVSGLGDVNGDGRADLLVAGTGTS